jgi:hypothetical protein
MTAHNHDTISLDSLSICSNNIQYFQVHKELLLDTLLVHDALNLKGRKKEDVRGRGRGRGACIDLSLSLLQILRAINLKVKMIPVILPVEN